ncbi:tetratricopeptide repeat protein [Paracoccaceae bacterium GXU_MW_L88]
MTILLILLTLAVTLVALLLAGRAILRDAAPQRAAAAQAELVDVAQDSAHLSREARRRNREEPAASPSRAARYASLAVLLALLAGGGALYWTIGAPGYRDHPMAERRAAADAARAAMPTQAEAEANAPDLDFPENPDLEGLVAELETALETRDDPTGWRLLARSSARLGDFVRAREAQQNVVASEDAALADRVDLVEYMFFAAGGYLSPEARDELQIALDLDPAEPRARYYLGQALLQDGDQEGGIAVWEDLLADSPAEAPWVGAIEAQMAQLAPLRNEARGPSAADIDAAEDMAPEDRDAFIRSMVEGLESRLATEGGSPEDWARLIRSLGVLGETDRARAIAEEAETRFADAPDALADIRAAAESLP